MGLRDLGQLVGEWTLEATHPAFPDLVVPGRSSFEWLDGERFMIQRSTADHPDRLASPGLKYQTSADRSLTVRYQPWTGRQSIQWSTPIGN